MRTDRKAEYESDEISSAAVPASGRLTLLLLLDNAGFSLATTFVMVQISIPLLARTSRKAS
jgi:hypothetical protein